jgi:hypothetical protein
VLEQNRELAEKAMNIEYHHTRFRRFAAQLAFLGAVILAPCMGTAWSQDVYCTESSPNGIQAMLDSWAKEKNVAHSITIYGVCAESVLVEGFTSLSLNGGRIQRTYQANSDYPDGKQWLPVLQVRGCERVDLNNLAFEESPDTTGTSGRPNLVGISRSNVGIYGCTIEGSRGGGLGIDDKSNVDLVGAKIKNNLGGGINAGGHSRLTISIWSYWSPGGDVPTLIEGSGSATDFAYGVNASNGAEVSIGWAEIKDNPGGGVTASNSGRVDLGEWGPHAPIITGNGRLAGPAAVAAGGGGEIWIIPPTAIQDNPANGAIADLGGRLVVCCGDPVHISNNQGFGVRAWGGGSVSFWSSAQVEGNKRGGISLFWGKAYLNRDVLIQQNGDPLDPNSYGGLILEADSSAEGAFAVSNNNGPGVWIKGGSHAVFYKDTSITKNRGNGVQLEMDGIAEFNDGNKVSGNKPFDLFCTAGTTVGAPKGAKPSIGKISCTGWTQFLPLPAWQASER